MRCENENRRSDHGVAAPGGDGRAIADAIRARARQLGGPLGAAWAGDGTGNADLAGAVRTRRRRAAAGSSIGAGAGADTPRGPAGYEPPDRTGGATEAEREPDRPRAVVHYERLASAARSSGAVRPSPGARRATVRLAAVAERGAGRLAG